MQSSCNQIKYFYHYYIHTYYVVLAWVLIQDKIVDANLINEEEFNKINQLIAFHDESKIDDEEWLPYARKFYPEGIQDEISIKKDFKEAVKHHKDNNLHHFESLALYSGGDFKCFIIEMVCDYIAMGWELGDYVIDYYERTKDIIELPPEYKKYLESVLDVLKSSIPEVQEPLTEKRMAYLATKYM